MSANANIGECSGVLKNFYLRKKPFKKNHQLFFSVLGDEDDYVEVSTFILKNYSLSLIKLKDVRAHCYCASLVRTLYMTWRVPRHVFQARAPSRNSTKYRAFDLCGNLICEYFCWMLGDPHFFFGGSLPFLILSIILKNKKICTWEVLIISHILFKYGRIGTWLQVCAT